MCRKNHLDLSSHIFIQNGTCGDWQAGVSGLGLTNLVHCLVHVLIVGQEN